MASLRVARLRLADGTFVSPGDLTVAVGPNNGGKSRFLHDLEGAITTPGRSRVSVTEADLRPDPAWDQLADQIVTNARFDENGTIKIDTLRSDLHRGDPGADSPNDSAVDRAPAAQHRPSGHGPIS